MPTHNPLPCSHSSIAQRVGHEVVLLNTGNYPGVSNFLNQTDTWNGTDWTLGASQIAASPLPLRSDLSMAYDGTNVTMFGGRGQSETDGVFEDTWSWNGTVWTQVTGTSPFGRFGHKMAYLAGTGAVLFGGSNVLNFLNETWVFTGTWTQQSPAHSPSVRVSHAMAGGPSYVLLFGGSGTNAALGDTWKYDGADWTLQSPATHPSVRSGAVLAYDTANSNFVLFGGANESGLVGPETWTYNGTTWTQAAPAHTPSARVGAQMCYDSQAGAVLLFGGFGNTNANGETWKWTGTDWVQL